jgi:hypothetical protein
VQVAAPELLGAHLDDFITTGRERGMSARTIHDRGRRLKPLERWMRKRGPSRCAVRAGHVRAMLTSNTAHLFDTFVVSEPGPE